MSSRDRLSRDIGELASRRKSVTFDELSRVANQIKLLGIRVKQRRTRHAYQFTIGSKIIRVCTHNPTDKHVKKCYVDDFIEAMIELEFYEE